MALTLTLMQLTSQGSNGQYLKELSKNNTFVSIAQLSLMIVHLRIFKSFSTLKVQS